MTRWIYYKQKDGFLLTNEKNAKQLIKQGLITIEDKILYSFYAATFEEARAINHLREGYEPYKPIGRKDLCKKCGSIIYLDESGQCWKCNS